MLAQRVLALTPGTAAGRKAHNFGVDHFACGATMRGVRDERDFEEALQAIAEGASLRRCGLPKSTLLNRAAREPAFERRLQAAQQNGRLRLVAKPHVAGGERMDREELIAIITGRARDGVGWACRLMLELVDEQSDGSAIPARYMELLEG